MNFLNAKYQPGSWHTLLCIFAEFYSLMCTNIPKGRNLKYPELALVKMPLTLEKEEGSSPQQPHSCHLPIPASLPTSYPPAAKNTCPLVALQDNDNTKTQGWEHALYLMVTVLPQGQRIAAEQYQRPYSAREMLIASPY